MPLYDQEGQDLEAPEKERKARRQQRLQALSLWATFFFSAAVAFASSMQACYTRRYTDYAGRQLEAINDSSKDTQKLLELYRQQALASDRLAHAAEDQAASARRNAESTSAVARASRKTADAADASTRLARQSLVVSNAPLITLLDVQLTQAMRVGEKVEFSGSVVNNGRGAAIDLRFVVVVDFALSRVADDKPFAFGPGENPSQLVLEPGSRSNFARALQLPLSDQQFAAFQRGGLFLQIKGIAMYDDIFGEHYRKEVCNEYDYDPSGKALALAYCSSHNGPPEQIKSRVW